MTEPYDIVIIGGGPGGYVAALRARQLGARVALVELERVGGTCLNRGCIPTKAMVRGAEVFKLAQEAAALGIETGAVRLDLGRFMARRDQVVETLVSGVERLLAGSGVSLYAGQGRIAGGTAEGWRVIVTGRGADEQDVIGRRVIIATGAVPAPLPIPGADLPGVLDSWGLLQLRELPRHLVVIGAGVIGMEMAGIFHALGSQVTIVELLPTILPPVDPALARRFAALVRQRGLTLHTGARVTAITQREDGWLGVVFEAGPGRETVWGDRVLVATSRWPSTGNTGIEALGVALNGRAIAVNEYLETSVPGIYAIGDCIGGQMLAHVASYEGEVAVENIMGRRRQADYTVVPACVFTMPEIADVGLTEEQAKERGLACTVSVFPFTACAKALALGETEGQVRLVCEAGSGRVLGLHIMGPHASDLIAEGAVALRLGATAHDIAELIHAHPTLSEAVMEAGKEQLDGAIHYQRRRR